MAWRLRRQYSRFERRKRTAARQALYGSLFLLVAAAAAGRQFLARPLMQQQWATTDWAALPEVDLLRRYIRIDTTAQSGDELAAARLLAAELAKSDITATIEELPGKRANLWAIVEGRDPRAIVLHQHLDTDPVPDESVWKYGPWSAEIRGPWLYGRGAFDMKSVGVAQLVALRRLVESGRPLQRSVMFLATSSEEHGSDLGMRWILSAHPELRERFGVFLTEGGAVEARDLHDIKYWGTETAQKRFVEVVFCSGSSQRLEDLRQDLEDRSARPRLVPEVEVFWRAYGARRDTMWVRNLLNDPTALIGEFGWIEGLPKYLRAMLLSQTYAGTVRAAAGGGFELKVRLGLLPGVELGEVQADLLPGWATHGIPFQLLEPPGSTAGTSAESPDFRMMQEVLAEHYPGAAADAWVLVYSVTDARFVRPLGIPAYGFTPFPVLSTDTQHIGNPNELIELPGFVDGIEIYAELLRRLAT